MSESSRSAWNRIAGILIGILVVGLVVLAMNAGFRSWWSGEQEELVDRSEQAPRDRAAERRAREEGRGPARAMRDEASGDMRAMAPPPAAEPEPAPELGVPADSTGLTSGGRYSPGSREYNERYPEAEDNVTKLVTENPVSTFSLDVDTASYSLMRRYLEDGDLPPRQAIRVEELVNYFDYDYPLPEDRSAPFKPTVHIAPAPWDENRSVMRIGIKGFDIAPEETPAVNLVFLIDVSGSMDDPRKLPLVKQTLRLLTEQMREADSVGIVVYAGAAGTVLEPTSDRAAVLAALDRLQAGGTTAGAEGIRQAYALAERAFDKDKVNRVILATDGDFNVGITDPGRLEDFVAEKRKTGIFLTVLTYGTGNLNDRLTQKLSQAGNGNAAYIDKLSEARKVMVEEMRSTIFPIAKDVKVQVEFNPAQVSAYRLIGYETRLLNREDFDNDAVDAGDIGSGHSVTALYELYPAGAAPMTPLRYGEESAPADDDASGKSSEIAFLRMRYKLPDQDKSRLIERPVTRGDMVPALKEAPEDMRFAVAVAAFGQRLRGGKYLDGYGIDPMLALANGARGDDPFGYRAEFVQLMRLSKSAGALPELADVIAPLHRPALHYPEACGGGGGEVVLEYLVEPSGLVRHVKVLTATSECFADAASKAVKRWTFKPRIKGGGPVRSSWQRTRILFVPDEENGPDGSETADTPAASPVSTENPDEGSGREESADGR